MRAHRRHLVLLPGNYTFPLHFKQLLNHYVRLPRLYYFIKTAVNNNLFKSYDTENV